MQIRVVKSFTSVKRPVSSAQLRVDNWDDFGWQTLFQVRIFRPDGTFADLGDVKVLRVTADSPEKTTLGSPFKELPADHCSLGQRLSYYETLKALDDEIPGLAEEYLTAMHDAAVFPAIGGHYRHSAGFQTSLLRENTASVALEQARSVMRDGVTSAATGGLEFVYDLPGNDEYLAFNFGGSDDLPDRIQAVIGYNGVGKTRLLASIGMVAAAREADRLNTDTIEKYGSFIGVSPAISAVICVSYSAFDDFELPTHMASASKGRPALGTSYTYCGLRKQVHRGEDRPFDDEIEDADESLLKSIDEISREFQDRRTEAVRKLRLDHLEEIFEPVLREPSFDLQGPLPALDAGKGAWRRALGRLSTGHKIVLHILVHLCAKLEQRSLVLLDEPEMHLHPPLVAALLSAVQKALALNDSFAIVATHSPVVAQEIPGHQVMVLRRIRSASAVDSPKIETFGEDIGLLTSEIFNLDNTDSDFRRVLLDLAARYSLSDIEPLFSRGLSAQARMTILAEQARQAR